MSDAADVLGVRKEKKEKDELSNLFRHEPARRIDIGAISKKGKSEAVLPHLTIWPCFLDTLNDRELHMRVFWPCFTCEHSHGIVARAIALGSCMQVASFVPLLDCLVDGLQLHIW